MRADDRRDRKRWVKLTCRPLKAANPSRNDMYGHWLNALLIPDEASTLAHLRDGTDHAGVSGLAVRAGMMRARIMRAGCSATADEQRGGSEQDGTMDVENRHGPSVTIKEMHPQGPREVIDSDN